MIILQTSFARDTQASVEDLMDFQTLSIKKRRSRLWINMKNVFMRATSEKKRQKEINGEKGLR